MIKINKTDSIVDIILKIKNSNEKEVVLEFPFGHPVLHNYTSLKILKAKSGKKDLIIITNDQTAKKIGKNLGIKYSVSDNLDIIEYNYSFFEYFIYTFKTYFRELKDLLFQRDNAFMRKYSKYSDGKIGYFISTLLVSVLLLVFIFYFAVSKTYIYITPKIEIKHKAKNFVFAEMSEDELVLDENIIKLKKIEKTVSIIDKFGTSGMKTDTISNARGKITLFNSTDEKIDLKTNTRVQTDSGIVFLIEGGVSIPKATDNNTPGKIDAYAIARVNDADGKFIGSKGNIKSGISMIIPGLNKELQDKIYAVSASDFSGGKDDYKKVLSKEDIENAKTILRTKVENEALNLAKKEIEETNKINNVQYEILGVNNITKYSDFDVFGLENYTVGQEIDTFELSGTIKITTYFYNKGLLITKMRGDINNSILANIEELLEINASSLRIVNTISSQEKPFSLKATAQVEVFVIHNFLSKSNAYVNRLKNVVAGLQEEEAEKILLNNDKISNVKIEIRPFFMDKVSALEDNIVLKVMDLK